MSIFDDAPIGTVLYGVHEHYYEPKGSVITEKEFIVTKEVVSDHYEYKYKELITSDGATPRYYRAKDIGKKVFFTEEEAIQEARKLSDDHDRIWTRYGSAPIRRAFEKEE